MLPFTQSVLFSVATAAVLTTSPAAAAIQVTQCGASVPAGATGVLSADLDCSAATGDGVLLNNGATLMLGGFELIGNPSAASGTGVNCTADCSVVGPGTVRAFPVDGVFSPSGRVTVRDATIQDLGRHGVFANFISVFDSTISGAIKWAVYASSSATVSGSTVTNGEIGVIADSRDTLEQFRGTVTIIDSTLTGNGTGIFAYQRASIVNSSVDGNTYSGVVGKSILMRNSSANNNGFTGVDSSGLGRPIVSVIDSVVSGNGADGIYALDTIGQTDKVFGKLSVTNTEVQNNGGIGISAFSVTISDCTISDNSGAGVYAVRAIVSASTVRANGGDGLRMHRYQVGGGYVASRLSMKSAAITGNAFDGIDSDGKIKVSDSDVSGNALHASCVSDQVCVDIKSAVRPTLSATTCETSYATFDDTDWDVCSLDPM